jgi:hypothetical protein
VTIIAILNIIGGIIMIFVGLVAIALASIVPLIPPDALESQTLEGIDLSAPWLVGLITAVGGVFIAIGVASFVVAYGLWNGKGWAWTVTVVLAIIGIVLDAISIATGNFGSIISIIISAVILYYVYRPHVKAYFGKGPLQPQPTA